MPAADSARLRARSESLDACKGVAVVWMLIFHFQYDLAHFGLTQQNFLGDPFWTTQRTAIVAMFLGLAGWALGRRPDRSEPETRPFWRPARRWWQLAACAATVSVATYLVFPGAWVFFGVLHCVALLQILLRPLAAQQGMAGRPLLCLALGCLALLLPWLPRFEALSQGAWVFLGLSPNLPVTVDFVPVFPWLGVMLLGMALGRRFEDPPWFLPAFWRAGLAWVGRRSLSIYMLHQPVFWFLLWLVTRS